MSREIKFRVIEKHPDGLTDNDIEIYEYTGLKDKNGVEIYEGDIVQGRNRLRDSYFIEEKVHYLNGCFMFGNWNAHEYFNRHQEIEVIGNIQEKEAQ